MTYLAILCEIYSEEGYFVPFDRNLCFDISFQLHLEEMRVKEIIAHSVNIELFDAEIFKNQKVLSSIGIQQRFLEVAKRLKRRGDTDVLTFEKTAVITEITPVITEITPVITEITPVIDGNNPTKGKGKGKGKEKKEKTKKENLVINQFKNNLNHDTKKQEFDGTDEDAKRQAELDRMREAATTNR
jgi:hypothetical protein